jgi:outer membrane protein OmpA-like peptidoglycan-associated protein
MKLKLLLKVIPLILVGMGIAQAEGVHVYRPGEIPSASDIAKMLGGGAPAVRSSATDDSPAPVHKVVKRKSRGLALDAADEEPSSTVTGNTRYQTSRPAAASEPPPEAQASSGEGESAFALPIQFAYKSAQILPDAMPAIDAVAEGIKQAGVRVLVEGHTDAKGGAAYNRSLSRQRAEAVKRYLVRQHGIRPQNLIVVGKGGSEPLDPNDPYAAENRRVQFRAAR